MHLGGDNQHHRNRLGTPKDLNGRSGKGQQGSIGTSWIDQQAPAALGEELDGVDGKGQRLAQLSLRVRHPKLERTCRSQTCIPED